MNIFLDECGYTGDDLANADQPTFTLATLCASDEQAAEWKDEFFSGVQAAELKHTSLRKYPRQREMVLNFLRLPVLDDAVRVSVAHKRYALVCKIVDFVVEPLMRKDGIDLYHRGGNIATANLLFNVTDVITRQGFLRQMTDRFQAVIRERSPEAYDQFFEPLFDRSFSDNACNVLAPIALAHVRAPGQVFDGIPVKGALDVSFAAALSLMASWRSTSSDEITLVHDESSNMSKQKAVWDALVSPDLEPIEVGYDRRKVKYPIAVKETVFRSSADSEGLQLADVVAGAVTTLCHWYLAGCPDNDEYGVELEAAIGNRFLAHNVWPSKDVAPDDLDTIGEDAADPIDFVGDIAMRASEEPNE